jgi:hypothetical protein
MDNITQLLKKCRLIDLDVLGIECIPDLPSLLIIPGHRRGKEVVNGMTLVINRVKWRVVRGVFLVQNDSFNCGPIACVKLMELYQRIDLVSSEKCYGSGRIRSVVVDEWEHLVGACDVDGILHVKDSRSDVAGDDCGSHSDNQQSSSLDYGDSSDTDNSEIDQLSINDENGLFFRPDCSSMCITNSHIPQHPCNKGHQNCHFPSKNIPSRLLQQQCQENFHHRTAVCGVQVTVSYTQLSETSE